jgi:hypothetical protein
MPAASVRPTMTSKQPCVHDRRIWRAHRARRLAHEAALFAILLAERLDDAQRSEHFLDDRHRRAFRLLDLRPVSAKTPPRDRDHCEQRRYDGAGAERERPIEPGGHGNHRHERERRRHERHDAVYRQVLNRLRVVADAIDRIGAAAAIVKREGEALDMSEQARLQFDEQSLRRVSLQHPRRHGLELIQERRADEHQQGDGQRRARRSVGREGHQGRIHPGSGRPPMALSTTILSGSGPSSAIGVASRFSVITPAI